MDDRLFVKDVVVRTLILVFVLLIFEVIGQFVWEGVRVIIAEHRVNARTKILFVLVQRELARCQILITHSLMYMNYS